MDTLQKPFHQPTAFTPTLGARILSGQPTNGSQPTASMQSSRDNTEPEVSALMRGLVHELRNPLSAIITASNLLTTSGAMDEETIMLLDVVHKESHRMNQILTDFSIYVKPPRAHPDPFDLTQVVRRLIRENLGAGGTHARDGDSSSGPTSWEVIDELPPRLDAIGDLQCTERAWLKIMDNAREALPNGGAIKISGATDGNFAWVSIENGGEMLEEGDAERAFDPFFTTKSGAVGLGLAIARSILVSSRGTIALEPIPNGTRVLLTLPTPPANSQAQ